MKWIEDKKDGGYILKPSKKGFNLRVWVFFSQDSEAWIGNFHVGGNWFSKRYKTSKGAMKATEKAWKKCLDGCKSLGRN